MENRKKIKIEKDGPYIVSGNIPLEKEFVVPDNNNDPLKWKKGERCEAGGGRENIIFVAVENQKTSHFAMVLIKRLNLTERKQPARKAITSKPKNFLVLN